MRPRFSLRWLLILFAFFAFALYFCFVRPTALANKFVYLVEHDDLKGADSLLIEPHQPLALVLYAGTEPDQRVLQAVLNPRSWEDIWKCRRRIDIHVIRANIQLSTFRQSDYFAYLFKAVAGVSGVRCGGQQAVMIHPEERFKKRLAEKQARQQQ